MNFPKIAVVGSRDFPDQRIVERFVFLLPRHWTIVSGGARGVDRWAEETANYWRRHTDIYPANWNKYGKSAGYIRNNEIVNNCDIVVAFWDLKSKGTKHTIQLARSLNKPCIIISRG